MKLMYMLVRQALGANIGKCRIGNLIVDESKDKTG